MHISASRVSEVLGSHSKPLHKQRVCVDESGACCKSVGFQTFSRQQWCGENFNPRPPGLLWVKPQISEWISAWVAAAGGRVKTTESIAHPPPSPQPPSAPHSAAEILIVTYKNLLTTLAYKVNLAINFYGIRLFAGRFKLAPFTVETKTEPS